MRDVAAALGYDYDEALATEEEQRQAARRIHAGKGSIRDYLITAAQIPGHLVQMTVEGIARAFTAPKRALEGEIAPLSEEMTREGFNLGLNFGLGTGRLPKVTPEAVARARRPSALDGDIIPPTRPPPSPPAPRGPGPATIEGDPLRPSPSAGAPPSPGGGRGPLELTVTGSDRMIIRNRDGVVIGFRTKEGGIAGAEARRLIDEEIEESLAAGRMDAAGGQSALDAAIAGIEDEMGTGGTHAPNGAPWADVFTELRRRRPAGPAPRAIEGRVAAPADDWFVPDEARTSANGTSAPQEHRGSNPARYAQDEVVMPSGERVQTRLEVVDLGDLRISHNLEGKPTPDYPLELQPRDRSSPASQSFIVEKAAKLEPVRLGRSPTPQEGAPIIGPDRVVESGNGRALMIARAYQRHPERAAEYLRFIQEQGFDTTGKRNPVLVRVRLGEVGDRAAFARQSNVSTTAVFSARERAQADAAQLDSALMDLWRPGETGSIANAQFVRAFADRLVDPGERPGFVSGEGRLSADGARRVEAAMVAKGWEAPDLVAALYEEIDPSSRAIIGAMADTGPLASMVKTAIKEGRMSAADDPTAAIVEAYRLVDRARRTNQKVADLVDQIDMERGAVPADVADAARLFFRDDSYRNAAGRDAVAAKLTQRLIHALDRQNAVGDLFGTPRPAAARAAGAEAPQAPAKRSAPADDWQPSQTGPVKIVHKGQDIIFPDIDHARLFDLGRRVEGGERVPDGEAWTIVEPFKGFVHEEPDFPLDTPADAKALAVEYFQSVVEEANKPRNKGRPYRATDTLVSEEAQVGWYRRQSERMDAEEANLSRGLGEGRRPSRSERPAERAAARAADPTVQEPPPASGAPPRGPVEPPERPAGFAEDEPAGVGHNGGPPLDRSQRAVLDRIGESRNARQWDWHRLYTDVKDDLHPIKQAVDELTNGRTLKAELDPYVLARLTRGSAGKAQHFIEHSPFRFGDLKDIGKSLKAILKPVQRDLDGFRAFALSKRALELAGRDIETGVPLREARNVVLTGEKKYGTVFRELVGYQMHLIQYLKDSGLISGDMAGKMLEANRDYVPFYRIMEDAEGPGVPHRGAATRNPVRGIKGSRRQIADPIESIVRNTYLFVTLAERNRALQALAKLAEATPRGAEVMSPVKTPAHPVTISEAEASRFMKEQGIEGDPAPFTVFRPNAFRPTRTQIAVYTDGKPKLYEVAPDLAEAVNAMDRPIHSAWIKLLSAPAKTLRAGATLVPEFVIKNMIRDQAGAFVNSTAGYRPYADFLTGLGSIIGKTEAYRNWLKNGGANSAMVSIDRRYIDQNVVRLTDRRTLMAKARNVVRSPLEMLRIMSEMAENATRVGEFSRGSRRGRTGARAAFDSREVTLDFQRVGARMQALNSMTAFLNATLEGGDRLARAFKARPFATFSKAIAAVTIPSILLWAANHDDERVKEASEWERDNFWLIPVGNTVYKIPKPFELGMMFGSLPERILDEYATENPEAFRGFLGNLIGAFAPSLIPTAASPLLEQWVNWDFFLDRPLVGKSLEDVKPPYQSTTWTSETAKLVGGLLDKAGLGERTISSPIVLENYVSDWTGTLGRYALQAADWGLEKAGVAQRKVTPTAALSDIPVIRSFVLRHPSSNARSIEIFYDNYARANSVKRARDLLKKRGDIEGLSALPPSVTLDKTARALSVQRKLIESVYANPDIPPDEKRELIDRAYSQMIEAAQLANEVYRTVENELAEPPAPPKRAVR